MAETLDFNDLSLVEIPVNIDGASYVLREASEDAARQYQNAITRCTQLQDGKVSGISGPLADTQSMLVSLCLFSADGKRVPETKVRQWPARVVSRLFDKAKDISELGGDDTEESLQKEADAIQEKLKNLREDALGNE